MFCVQEKVSRSAVEPLVASAGGSGLLWFCPQCHKSVYELESAWIDARERAWISSNGSRRHYPCHLGSLIEYAQKVPGSTARGVRCHPAASVTLTRNLPCTIYKRTDQVLNASIAPLCLSDCLWPRQHEHEPMVHAGFTQLSGQFIAIVCPGS